MRTLAGFVLLLALACSAICGPALASTAPPPLHQAAEQGDTQALRALLREGISPDSADIKGRTALHRAVMTDQEASLRLLLAQGADPDLPDALMLTPLHYAAKARRPHLVALLIDAGAQPDIQFQPGLRPLYLAALEGDAGSVELLLGAGADPDLPTSGGDTPIQQAVTRKHTEVVEALLQGGASADLVFDGGRTFLQYAISEHSLPLLDLLLRPESGLEPTASELREAMDEAVEKNDVKLLKRLVEADVEMMTVPRGSGEQEGEAVTLLEHFFDTRDRELLDLLLEKGGGQNTPFSDGRLPLEHAICKGKARLLDALLNLGVDPDALLSHGQRPLHLAMSLWEFDLTRRLLEAGASTELTTEDGLAPILVPLVPKRKYCSRPPVDWRNSFSYHSGYMKYVELLLEHGARVDGGSPDGPSAMHQAVRFRNKELAELLLQRGAPTDLLHEGRTPLAATLERGSMDKVEYLLASGCGFEVSADDYPFDEALVMAARAGLLSLLRPLVAGGADPGARSFRDRGKRTYETPLHAAAREGRAELASLLIELGAPLEAADHRGATPLFVAAQEEQWDMTLLLLRSGADPAAARGDRLALGEVMGQPDEALLNAFLDALEGREGRQHVLDEALEDALDCRSAPYARLLLERGASISHRTVYGSVLCMAVARGMADTVELLLERGADPNETCSMARTALTYAVEPSYGSADTIRMVESLLAAGARVDGNHRLRSEVEDTARPKRAPTWVERIREQGLPIGDEPRRDLQPPAWKAEERTQPPPAYVPTPLVRAAQCKPHLITTLLSAGADADARGEHARTALHLVVGNELLRDQAPPSEIAPLHLVRALIEAGASLDAEDDGGRTALIGATRLGDMELMRALLDAGADPNHKDALGNTALAYARDAELGAQRRPLSALLLERGAHPDLVANHSDALIRAVVEGDTDDLLARLDAGAHPDDQDLEGATAAWWAVRKCRLDALRILLEHGADADLALSGREPYLLSASGLRQHRSCLNNDVGTGLVELLLDHGANVGAVAEDGTTALIQACGTGDPELVGLLLEKKRTRRWLNARNADGITALHAASKRGKPGIVELLLDAGADVDLADRWGYTPLMWNQEDKDLSPRFQDRNNDKSEITELLLGAGADISARAQGGVTPLMVFIASQDMASAKLLIERGATVDQPDEQGRTPLHLAAGRGEQNLGIFDLVVTDATLDRRDQAGMTPLAWAAWGGDNWNIPVLAGFGASMNARDDHGLTPLMWAAARGHDRTADALLQFGADPGLEVEGGFKAADYARAAEHELLAEKLEAAEPRHE